MSICRATPINYELSARAEKNSTKGYKLEILTPLISLV
jgi:hypothetical protein